MSCYVKSIYRLRPNAVGQKLLEGRQKFGEISLLEQIYIILQILQLSQLINNRANLDIIEKGAHAGVPTLNKKISDCNEFKLINQSITGLYENEVDLLTI